MQSAREAQVEVGIVDEDREVGALAVHLGEQAAEDPPEVREVGHHLPEADDREIANVGQQGSPFAFEPVAAQAEDAHRRLQPGAKMTDEIRGVEVAGGLTAGDEEPRHQRAV
jgi:hypothetical protein